MNIFVSYRRSDSRHIAGRLSEKLDEMPGVSRVFIDVEGIEAGTDFEKKLSDSLDECDVCLILIGDEWVGVENDEGRTRIFDDEDFVRLEVAKALSSGKRVIPILVDGAGMPRKSELPADLESVVSIDAVFLRHSSFKQDIELVEDALFRRGPRTPISRFFMRHPFLTLSLKIMGGVFAAAILLVVLLEILRAYRNDQYLSLSDVFGGAGLMWVVIVTFLMSGGGLAAWLTRRR